MKSESDIMEEEVDESMTITEVTRMNDWLRAMGMSDSDILACQNYIATGIGLPIKDSDKEE